MYVENGAGNLANMFTELVVLVPQLSLKDYTCM